MARQAWNRGMEPNRVVLKHIRTLLLALAVLVDRTAALPKARRLHLLAVLGRGEAEARRLILEMASDRCPGDPAVVPVTTAGDAALLAARFRMLALAVNAVLAQAGAEPPCLHAAPALLLGRRPRRPAAHFTPSLALRATSPPLNGGEEPRCRRRCSSCERGKGAPVAKGAASAIGPPLPSGERVAAQRPGEGVDHAGSHKTSARSNRKGAFLRQDDTEPEYRLWGELRNRRLNGYKFVRQVPIGPYFADFVCREVRLIIELDGSQHSESRRDVITDAFLVGQGYSVLRFWNDEVLKERRPVLETILAALEGRLSPSPGLRFAPATLSPRGEEVANRSPSRAASRRFDDPAEPPLPTGERVAGAKRRPGEGAISRPAKGVR